MKVNVTSHAGFLFMFKLQIGDNARGQKQVVEKLHLACIHVLFGKHFA